MSESMIQNGSNVLAEYRLTMGSDDTLTGMIEDAGGTVPASMKRVLFRLGSGASGNRNTGAAASASTPAIFDGWLPCTPGGAATTHIAGTGTLDVIIVG